MLIGHLRFVEREIFFIELDKIKSFQAASADILQLNLFLLGYNFVKSIYLFEPKSFSLKRFVP